MTLATNGTSEDRADLRIPAEPSAFSGAERAIDAAQRIAVERIELIRLEAQEALAGLIQRSGLILFAGLVMLLGWSALAAGAVALLATRISFAESVALVGGLHFLAGLGVVIYAGTSDKRRRTS